MLPRNTQDRQYFIDFEQEIRSSARRALEHHRNEWMPDSGVSEAITDIHLNSFKDYYDIATKLNWSDKLKYLNKNPLLGGGWFVRFFSLDNEAVCAKLGTPRNNLKTKQPLKYEQRFKGASGILPVLMPMDQFLAVCKQHDVTPTDEDIQLGQLHVFMKYSEIPVYITEGAKKAAALATHGMVSIALQGVETWSLPRTKEDKEKHVKRALRTEWAVLIGHGRKVVIVPDNDVKARTVVNVTSAFCSFAQALTDELQAKVLVMETVGKFKGIDDIIKHEGIDRVKSFRLLEFEAYQVRAQRPLGYHPEVTINTQKLTVMDIVPVLNEKLVGIRSAKGTGKTELQLLLMADVEIVIVHRTSLVSQIHASKLAVAADYGHYMIEGHINGKKRIVICIDSLHKLNPSYYAGAQIIINEADQVLEHLLASTTLSERQTCLETLRVLCESASRVILMDADLSSPTLDYFSARCNAMPSVVLNQFTWSGYKAEVFYCDDHYHLDVYCCAVEDIKAGKKLFIYTDSRRYAKKYTELLLQEFADLSVFTVHGDNSGEPHVKHFITKCITRVETSSSPGRRNSPRLSKRACSTW